MLPKVPGAKSWLEARKASPDKHRVAGVAAATFTWRAFQPPHSLMIRVSAMPNMINDDNSGYGMHLIDDSTSIAQELDLRYRQDRAAWGNPQPHP